MHTTVNSAGQIPATRVGGAEQQIAGVETFSTRPSAFSRIHTILVPEK
jgi:hypothetical protein